LKKLGQKRVGSCDWTRLWRNYVEDLPYRACFQKNDESGAGRLTKSLPRGGRSRTHNHSTLKRVDGVFTAAKEKGQSEKARRFGETRQGGFHEILWDHWKDQAEKS